eukprot:1319042-Alexandrium_andersonii.AAC.1
MDARSPFRVLFGRASGREATSAACCCTVVFQHRAARRRRLEGPSPSADGACADVTRGDLAHACALA